MEENKMQTKKISQEEAKKIAQEKYADSRSFGNRKYCLFVGNYEEVFEHAVKKHHCIGAVKIERLDGSQFVSNQYDGDEGHWNQSELVYVQDDGKYWFVCTESQDREWRKISDILKTKLNGEFMYDIVCINTMESVCENSLENIKPMSEGEEKEFMSKLCRIYGKNAVKTQ